MLPEQLNYSIKKEGRTITIGPIIGYIAISREKELNEENLNKKLEYFYRYSEIEGLVFICKSNSFDFDNETVSGYAYAPTETPGEYIWIKGTFPLPAAIYNRMDLTRETFNKLILRMGDKIFNSYFFNKIELFKYLTDCPKTKKYLPETATLASVSNAVGFLQKYKTVYLKPSFKNKSKGIAAISKAENGLFLLQERSVPDRLYTISETSTFIAELMKTDSYIVQQGIEIALYEERRYDFRVVMQKGYSMKWECTAIFARFGAVNAPVTNFTVSGFALNGYDALKKVFRLSDRQAFTLEKNIIAACMVICDRIDFAAGNYGDVGIDIVVDKNRKIWVLEINKLHDHHFPILATEDMQLYYEIVTKPLFYAKALAGF